MSLFQSFFRFREQFRLVQAVWAGITPAAFFLAAAAGQVLFCGKLCAQSDSPQQPDHARIIRAWNQSSFERGERLYNSICITCHGNLEREGSIPNSRPFWLEPFKNGNDPHSLYRTVTEGFGQMPAWPWLTPELRYDVIHYIREAFVRPHNPPAYFKVTPDYLAKLPKATGGRLEKSGKLIEFEKGPPYLRMDFGPLLFWTYEVAADNIAYKGIAIRLDQGPGGVSRGNAWIIYDHDTMRVAAAWTGPGFIDWKGIAFDGSHGTHSSIVGERVMVNPVGPGWARPGTDDFSDARLRGKDGKPYGPLERSWARYGGVHLGERIVLEYTVGDARVLESPALLQADQPAVFARTLNVGRSSMALRLRIAPTNTAVALASHSGVQLAQQDGSHVISIPAGKTPLRLKILMARPESEQALTAFHVLAMVTEPAEDLAAFTRGGPARWNGEVAVQGGSSGREGLVAVDTIPVPNLSDNPWNAWLRPGGFDFFPDGQIAALATWNGDVWLVKGLAGDLAEVRWKRIATGLFQPLGLKIVDGVIHVTCRDQLARLHDRNGDEEIDWIESFNNDHQVTEHFHEFAMGLQTDSAGNFYYTKGARHAKTDLVPHHGTLLKVMRDGSSTEVVANGFRAPNGVCVNSDGSFFVTDQEGHWHPKNRVNRVRRGGFYGNMWSYGAPADASDGAMEEPVVWITNEMDRSPAELLWVRSEAWKALHGSILNLSYGMGRIYLVLLEEVNGREQGGVVALPLPDFPTGIMRGRWHPANGQLYVCGMFAWAGNQQQDGGFYRLRLTGRPLYLPVRLRARRAALEMTFTEPLDAVAARDPNNYEVRRWDLHRSKNYGSKHLNEQRVLVQGVSLSPDGKTVRLAIPDLAPTRGMKVHCRLRGADGTPFERTIHNTIHALAEE